MTRRGHIQLDSRLDTIELVRLDGASRTTPFFGRRQRLGRTRFNVA